MQGVVETPLKNLDEALRSHRKRPLNEFIREAARARGRGVRGAGQGKADFVGDDGAGGARR
jgi:hypothetical protein